MVVHIQAFPCYLSALIANIQNDFDDNKHWNSNNNSVLFSYDRSKTIARLIGKDSQLSGQWLISEISLTAKNKIFLRLVSIYCQINVTNQSPQFK
jgi:hypothetical protein